MSKTYENIKGIYESMSCETKTAAILGLANFFYFFLYVLSVDWLSFLMTKGIIFLFLGMAKTKFLGKQQKR
jgi:hypothetical protein